MLRRDPFDFGALVRRNVCDDQVLVRGETEVAVMHFGDAAKPRQLGLAWRVEHAAVLDEQRQMRVAVLALAPAVAVARRGEGNRTRRLQRDTRAALSLGLE